MLQTQSNTALCDFAGFVMSGVAKKITGRHGISMLSTKSETLIFAISTAKSGFWMLGDDFDYSGVLFKSRKQPAERIL